MKNIDLEQLLTGDNAEMLKEKMKEVQRDLANYMANPDPELAESVQTQNIHRVRALLQLDLRDKRVSFKEIMQKTFYVQEKLSEVFRPLEISKLHREYLLDSSKWDEDYFQSQFSYLTVNFAVERVIHLANVKYHFDPQEKTIHNKHALCKQVWNKVENVFEMFREWVEKIDFTPLRKNKKYVISGVVAVGLIVLCLIW